MATLYESNNISTSYFTMSASTSRIAQTFTPTISHTITEVQLYLARYQYNDYDPGLVTVSIKATNIDGEPTGDDLCYGTVNGSTLTKNPTFSWISFSMGEGVNLAANEKYAIVIKAAFDQGFNQLYWRYGTAYKGLSNCLWTSLDSGSNWTEFDGSDMCFREYGNPLSPEKPINPTPANDATEVDFSDLTLSWEDGGGATSYDVYIGPTGSLTKVSSGQAGLSYETTLEELESIFGSPLDDKIYWRIDAINDSGTTTGDEWNFDARPGKVATTTPEDDATGINLNATTGSWESPSDNTNSYNIYYGTLSGFLSLVGNTEDLELALLGEHFPQYGEIYYWRVDAVNDFGITQGDELSFTTLVFDPTIPTGMILEDEELTGTPTGENNMITVRRLVAAADDAIWYEDI